MRKTFHIILFLALVAGTVSCSKQGSEIPVSYARAYAPGVKTTLAADKSVCWSEGDKITLSDGANAYEYVLDGGESTTSGIFKHSGEVAPGDGYTAYYPSTYDGSAWPADQKYEPVAASARENKISYAPMKAENITIDAGGNVTDFSFRNEGGILQLKVKGSDKVDFVSVGAKELPAITLDCSEADVVLSSGEYTVFNIALPLGEYTDGVINLVSDKSAAVVLKAGAFKVERNKVYSYEFAQAFDFPDYVDMGLSVYWAICNLGATAPEGYGNYYMWGSVVDNSASACNADSDYPFKGQTVEQMQSAMDEAWNLKADYDAAAKASSGRMPTYDEFNELMDGSKCTWKASSVNSVGGYKVTSKIAGYEGRSIFIPFAGQRKNNEFVNRGERCYYWTSTHSFHSGVGDEKYRAYNMYCYDPDNSTTKTMARSYLYYGMPIRPVFPKK